MSDTLHGARTRAFAIQRLEALLQAPGRAFSIHYALQRLRRDAGDLTPPVAAVAVRNLGSGEQHAFSIKAEADRAGLDLSAPTTPAQLLQLEYSLLFRLNDFLERHGNALFVHWYMRDERFGFQALDARYRTAMAQIVDGLHGGRNAASAAPIGFGSNRPPSAIAVDAERRVDLAAVLRQVYGIGPVGLRDLAQANGLSLAELIDGKDEPMAFAEGKHARLAWSSATKARLIAELAGMAHLGTIKPAAPRQTRATGAPLRIFINYRRQDTEAEANWLHEILSEQFGDDNVFIDTDDIQAGMDFEQVLRQQIDSCDVFLAMIGRDWATAVDERGHRRLAGAQDFVRREIRAALAREVLVIPVLIEGTPLPSEMEFPADIAQLRRRHAVGLRIRDFRQDVERMVGQIRQAHRAARKPAAASGLA